MRAARTMIEILQTYVPVMPLLVDVENAFVQPWLLGYEPSPFAAYFQYTTSRPRGRRSPRACARRVQCCFSRKNSTMRVSKFYLSTLKEAPAEADVTSQKLMLRAGLIKKLGTGLYTWMPLGLITLRKVEQIIREEMNRAGALELVMPVDPAGRTVAGNGPLGEDGPQHAAAEGPARARLRRRPDARGGDHRHRAPRDPQLPPAAGELLPDPDQVPRRDPPALRRDARARVHHEGRLLVRRRRRRHAALVPGDVRRLRAHLHAHGPEVPRGRRRHGRDRRHVSHEFQVLADSGEDAIAFCDGSRLRGQRREGRGDRAGRPARRARRSDGQGAHARHVDVRGGGAAPGAAADAHREVPDGVGRRPRAHAARARRPHGQRGQDRQAAGHGRLALGLRCRDRGGDRLQARLPRSGRHPARKCRSSSTARSRR